MYDYDAVSRLAQAQVIGQTNDQQDSDWKSRLFEGNFLRPGILWQAFDWESAGRQANLYHVDRIQTETSTDRSREPVRPVGWNPGDGCVVLIDEIDKADTDVPNGMLEALGNLGFEVPHTGESVALDEGSVPPLVVITTNEERELPPAFLRRCLVHAMNMQRHEDGERGFLLERGRIHFADSIGDKVYDLAADQLLDDRS